MCAFLLTALWCILNVLQLANGRYQLEVKLFRYNNPTRTCRGCRPLNDQPTCCDDFERTRRNECGGDRQCDVYFIYCLRPLGSEGRGCFNYPNIMMSDVESDTTSYDFDQDRTELGLPNPLHLPGLTETYTGVQLYIEIRDEDIGSENREGANEPDELVDILLINHNLTVGEESPRQSHSTFFVTMELAISVNCVDNFQGSDCTQCVPGLTGPDCLEVDDCFNLGINCSGNGQCVDGVDSFNCSCDPGFTGELCQSDIDECVGVNCNRNGWCVDGVDSFSCNCSAGYTGAQCEIDIDDCVGVSCSGNRECLDGVNSFTCECSPGYTGPLCDIQELGISSSIGGAIGGAIAAIISMIVIALVVVLAVVFAMRWREDKRRNKSHDGTVNESRSPPIPMSPVCCFKSSPDQNGVDSMPERQLENPIYGEDELTDNTYTVPFELHQNERSLTNHKFDNPVYGIGDSNTYEVPCDANTLT